MFVGWNIFNCQCLVKEWKIFGKRVKEEIYFAMNKTTFYNLNSLESHVWIGSSFSRNIHSSFSDSIEFFMAKFFVERSSNLCFKFSTPHLPCNQCLTVLFPLFLTVHLSVTVSPAKAVIFRALSPKYGLSSTLSDLAVEKRSKKT